MTAVEEMAFAKVNLDLRICGRRADGYHDLDSLVVFAGIGDRLTFEPADDLSVVIEGPFREALPDAENNLVVAAARSLAAMVDRRANVRITLEKRLPVASGLGGGSADAAATLRGLARLWDLPLTAGDLTPVARSLGADVPVCLGSMAARMRDTGHRLSPFTLPGELFSILVNPGEAVATADVFRAVDAFSGSRPETPIAATRRSAGMSFAESGNDLEAPAMRLVPAIGTALDAIRSRAGCTLARMSGSGATCFGLFDDAASRDDAAASIAASHPDWWVVGTVLR